MKINHLKIGTRLYLGFGFVLLLLVGCIALGVANMAAINNTLLTVTNENNVKLAAVEQMSKAQLSVTITASNVVLLTDAAARESENAKVLSARQRYGQASDVLHKLIRKPEGKEILATIDAAAAMTRPLTDKARQLGMDGQTEEATRVLITELAPASEKWQLALEAMRAHQVENNEAAEKHASAAYIQARSLLISMGVLAVVFSAAMAWFVTRTIVRPMREAVHLAQLVAAGDLSGRIEPDGSDETAELLAALNEMNASLQDIVGRVRAGTDLIATASSEVAAGSLDLSARTEQQAGSLEETASSMEELASTVRQNADNARQADVLSTTASQVAVKGGAVVAQVVQTMGSIHESSKKIVDIISVIDGIAFQTNILALNAAVEAARAGEQGRGFAVVASEVRNLAQRSAAAAKEIKLLIDDSVGKVAAGSALVRDAGTTMEELVVSVKQVSDIMGEISAAGREQELGIGQINQAVVEMDAVTQQNAALVEQASAAAESLQEQARELASIVSVFKLSGVAHALPARAHSAPVVALPPGRAVPAKAVPARPAPRARKLANGADVEQWDEF